MGGDFAGALFNRAQESASITFDWVKAGFKKTPSARDLLSHSVVKLQGNVFPLMFLITRELVRVQ